MAFDFLDHKLFLSKNQCYGIGGSCYDWLKIYITLRKQYVKIAKIDKALKVKCTG